MDVTADSLIFESSGVLAPAPTGTITLPLNMFYTVTTAPTTIDVECTYTQIGSQPYPTDVEAPNGGIITAIQVQ
jgi:hypothetical protein